MSSPIHWNEAFAGDVTSRGWYQPNADVDWSMVGEISDTAAVLDVGGGASAWVDGALDRGFTDITVLDWAEIGLRLAQQRLGSRSDDVTWIVGDVTTWQPERAYQLWHDRAVLHFLLDERDKHSYRRTLLSATERGSILVLGVFNESGPSMCAGLPVHRWSVSAMKDFLGNDFTLERQLEQQHRRPDGDMQDYVWVRARRL